MTEDNHDENKLIAQRREKLTAIREQRVAFPNGFVKEHSSAVLTQQYESKTKEELEELAIGATLAGRIIRMRGPFIVIQDGNAQMQIYINNKSFMGEQAEQIKSFDLGDIIGVHGEMFKTGKGELTLRAASFELLTKSLRPLPDKHKGLTDTEMRYRQRYVDPLAHHEIHTTVFRIS
jgi:lysyl-tRNA synthetase, class II